METKQMYDLLTEVKEGTKTQVEAGELLYLSFVIQQREQLIDFFNWINKYEELRYTEKGIKFYVDEYLKSINCV